MLDSKDHIWSSAAWPGGPLSFPITFVEYDVRWTCRCSLSVHYATSIAARIAHCFHICVFMPRMHSVASLVSSRTCMYIFIYIYIHTEAWRPPISRLVFTFVTPIWREERGHLQGWGGVSKTHGRFLSMGGQSIACEASLLSRVTSNIYKAGVPI